MNITITFEDHISTALRKLGSDMPGILNFIVAAVAKRHKEHVRSRYLSGQVLSVRTGGLRDSIFYYKVAPAKYEVRPIGKLFNWAAGFETGMQAGPGQKVYIPPHPWQTPALRDIKSGIMDRLVNDLAMQEIRKRLGDA